MGPSAHPGPTVTIGQLAAYAGVTTRTVRHYHQAGLLPEADRDASGYRVYDVTAVVRLIRIRTLARAGVPLARVHEMLDADPGEFTGAIAQIDDELRRKISELQEHRRKIAKLDAGDELALPHEVVDYLDRLRAIGLTEEMITPERDMWIMFAAQWPDAVADVMADKVAQLDDPDVLRIYELVKILPGREDDEALLTEMADLIVALQERAAAAGDLDRFQAYVTDKRFVALMDSMALPGNPSLVRLRQLVADRGWTGWSWMEPVNRPDR